MREPPDLDDSQVSIAEADTTDRLLVTAAAGQGKTEVVVARLEFLADEGVSVFDDVIVLTFSRAAVDAARRRFAAAGLSQVRISTFDSFAASVLVEVGGIEYSRGFEHRIRLATEALRSGEFDVSHLEHLIVDEAQDLVGDRAELVLALIEAAPHAGFTILGDPLQAIYDFQLDGNASQSKRTSGELRQALVDSHDAEPTELTGHYRATSSRMSDLIPVGDRIRAMDPLDETAVGQAFETLNTYRTKSGGQRHTRPGLEHLTGFLDLDPEDGETSAILTATNYTALLVSEKLAEMGVRHTVRPRAQEIGVASWVASTLHAFAPRKQPREAIETALAGPDSSVPPDAWSRLKDVEGDRRDHRTLDLNILSRKLRSGSVPPVLAAPVTLAVTVSTVHRAKGLEFDHVIDMVPANADDGPGATTWRNLRRSYVASSRARESLFLVDEPTTERGYPKTAQGRWIEHIYAKNGPRPHRMELLHDDVEVELPHQSTSHSVVETLQYIDHNVLPGSPVEFVLVDSTKNSLKPIYLLKDDAGVSIGRASSTFLEALEAHLIFGKSPRWPERPTGARVSSVETIAGLPATGTDHGIPSGLWLAPRMSGLIRPRWNREKKAGTP